MFSFHPKVKKKPIYLLGKKNKSTEKHKLFILYVNKIFNYMSEHFLYIVTKISLSLADIVKQSHCILKDRVHVQFLGYKHVYVWGFFNFMLQNQSVRGRET